MAVASLDWQQWVFGGLIGLLVGDAHGVPYEFHPPESNPPADLIEYTRRRDFTGRTLDRPEFCRHSVADSPITSSNGGFTWQVRLGVRVNVGTSGPEAVAKGLSSNKRLREQGGSAASRTRCV